MQEKTEIATLYKENIFHDIDHGKCKQQLNRFYGRVANSQNKSIADLIQGKNVLDIGAGYGSLTKLLIDLNYNVIGIEPNSEKIEYARKWYDVDLLPIDIYSTNFKDNQFDCVIMREVVFHLDLSRAIEEINRICKKQIIIFQGNSILLRKIGQMIFGHREYNEKKPMHYVNILQENNYLIENLLYRDPIAFPLSGGFIGKQIIPDLPFLYNSIISLDKMINNILGKVKIQKYFCSRFIINALK